MNLKTGTRRSVRRVSVVMGSSKGKVCMNPVNGLYVLGEGPVQAPATGSYHRCVSHGNPYEDREPEDKRFNPFATAQALPAKVEGGRDLRMP